MPLVTLDDIQLRDYTLGNLALLQELRAELLMAKAEVCIERARFVTQHLRDRSSPDEPIATRYAGAVAHFLNHKAPLFFDRNLLAGTTTSKRFGAPVYPEFTGLTIWPELDTISTRAKNPLLLSRSEAEELNFDIFPYWLNRSILEYTRKKHGNPPCMKLFERLVFFLATKAGCISHTVPYYQKALQAGLEGLVAEAESRKTEITKRGAHGPDAEASLFFYQGVQTALTGAIEYAQHLRDKASALAAQETDPARQSHFRDLAEVLAQVPAKPARTFREAIQAIWLGQVAIHAENINMAMSPGRLDQILHPYYERDVQAGRLTVKEALELSGCLWLKLNDNTNLVPEASEELFGGAGTVPAVTLGGVDEHNEDAVNDLTYILLRVTELLQTRDPSVNARYHYQKNSPAYRQRISGVIAQTKSLPAVFNDAVNIKVLENQGTASEHARDYAVIGCVELAAAGRSYDASSAIMFNLVSALELALHNGKRPITADEQIGPLTGEPSSFGTFDEFFAAFKTQTAWALEQAIQLNEYFGKAYQEIQPSPLLSAYFDGPLEKGKDLIFGGARYNSSGATHIGFADTVDSLNAIEKAVYIDRQCTFPELLAALEADFAGCEKLHAYLVNKAPKYGTLDPIAVKNSNAVIRFLYDFYQGHTNYRGGKYRPGYWTMTNHAGQGRLCGALPSGRKAGQVFSSGITPVSQAGVDLGACLQAVGKLDGACIASGEALNLKFPTIETGEDEEKLGAAIEAYCRYGGLHIQFNIMSYELLLDAKKHPENYPELLVRVSGYSAYFKDLNDAMKDEIILRTAYDLRSGRAVPFPERFHSLLAGQ